MSDSVPDGYDDIADRDQMMLSYFATIELESQGFDISAHQESEWTTVSNGSVSKELSLEQALMVLIKLGQPRPMYISAIVTICKKASKRAAELILQVVVFGRKQCQANHKFTTAVNQCGRWLLLITSLKSQGNVTDGGDKAIPDPSKKDNFPRTQFGNAQKQRYILPMCVWQAFIKAARLIVPSAVPNALISPGLMMVMLYMALGEQSGQKNLFETTFKKMSGSGNQFARHDAEKLLNVKPFPFEPLKNMVLEGTAKDVFKESHIIPDVFLLVMRSYVHAAAVLGHGMAYAELGEYENKEWHTMAPAPVRGGVLTLNMCSKGSIKTRVNHLFDAFAEHHDSLCEANVVLPKPMDVTWYEIMANWDGDAESWDKCGVYLEMIVGNNTGDFSAPVDHSFSRVISYDDKVSPSPVSPAVPMPTIFEVCKNAWSAVLKETETVSSMEIEPEKEGVLIKQLDAISSEVVKLIGNGGVARILTGMMCGASENFKGKLYSMAGPMVDKPSAFIGLLKDNSDELKLNLVAVMKEYGDIKGTDMSGIIRVVEAGGKVALTNAQTELLNQDNFPSVLPAAPEVSGGKPAGGEMHVWFSDQGRRRTSDIMREQQSIADTCLPGTQEQTKMQQQQLSAQKAQVGAQRAHTMQSQAKRLPAIAKASMKPEFHFDEFGAGTEVSAEGESAVKAAWAGFDGVDSSLKSPVKGISPFKVASTVRSILVSTPMDSAPAKCQPEPEPEAGSGGDDGVLDVEGETIRSLREEVSDYKKRLSQSKQRHAADKAASIDKYKKVAFEQCKGISDAFKVKIEEEGKVVTEMKGEYEEKIAEEKERLEVLKEKHLALVKESQELRGNIVTLREVAEENIKLRAKMRVAKQFIDVLEYEDDYEYYCEHGELPQDDDEEDADVDSFESTFGSLMP